MITGFQASKFVDHYPDVAEQIRHLPTPRAALQEATRRQRLRRHDWFDVNLRVMDAVLEAKFTQHHALYKLLLETGDRELIEASPVRQHNSGTKLAISARLITYWCYRSTHSGVGERMNKAETSLVRL